MHRYFVLRSIPVLFATALAFGGPAFAQGADGSDDAIDAPSSLSAPNIARTSGVFNAFRSVAAETRPRRVGTTSSTFVPIPGMSVSVPTVRGSQMLVTFSAECKADSPSGRDVGVVVQIRVNGVPVPYQGTEDNLILCANKQFFFETHSHQWFVRARTRRPEVTAHFAMFGGGEGDEALLSDRALTVMYEARPD
ncbi:MAG: hypothetical protein ACK4NW_08210 [Roseinatronobacter sp.]